MGAALRQSELNTGKVLLALDIVFIFSVAIAACAIISTPGLLAALNMEIARQSLVIFGALVVGGIVVLGAIGARTLRHPRPAWLGAAFALDGVFAIPLAALDPQLLGKWPGLMVTMVTADIATALLLVIAARPPLWLGTWAAGATALAGAVVAVALGLLAPQLVGAVGLTLLDTAAALIWAVAGTIAIHVGARDEDSATWRVGIGLMVIGLSHTYRVAAELQLTVAGLGFLTMQLVGGIAVLGGLLRRLRGEVIMLTSQTDRQQTELQEASDGLRRAAEQSSERSHELANGLAGLSGLAFLLEDPAARQDMPALRTAVVSELSRMHALLVEPEGARPRDFDVADLVTEAALLHRGRGMDIRIVTDGLTSAYGDRAAVGQVVTNLLVNCERHAPGSTVRIHIAGTRDQVLTVVEDDGPGVPVGAERAVVQRGSSGANSIGSGLGLHVSARLMESQRGSLQVLPGAPGRRGFAVRLELPTS
jgi:two-component system, OmpR family, sensor kinase